MRDVGFVFYYDTKILKDDDFSSRFVLNTLLPVFQFGVTWEISAGILLG